MNRLQIHLKPIELDLIMHEYDVAGFGKTF